MRKQSKHEKAMADVKAAGRQVWEIKPVTRVIPNKKKPKPLRKLKHKGRPDLVGPLCFRALAA